LIYILSIVSLCQARDYPSLPEPLPPINTLIQTVFCHFDASVNYNTPNTPIAFRYGLYSEYTYLEFTFNSTGPLSFEVDPASDPASGGRQLVGLYGSTIVEGVFQISFDDNTHPNFSNSSVTMNFAMSDKKNPNDTVSVAVYNAQTGQWQLLESQMLTPTTVTATFNSTSLNNAFGSSSGTGYLYFGFPSGNPAQAAASSLSLSLMLIALISLVVSFAPILIA
jgi:hypothetical protein